LNVLFISSGNSNYEVTPVVFNQGESLKKHNINIYYFTIKGKGITGYMKNVPRIKQHLCEHTYDLVHAHYSLSSFAVSLAKPEIPLIASLMGSDTKMKWFWRLLISLNYKIYWNSVIVKSHEMRQQLGLAHSHVIPNGVDLDKLRPRNKNLLKDKLGLSANRRYVLFVADPFRIEKNYSLAEAALDLVRDEEVELLVLYNRTHEEVIEYLYAADLLLLTSLWEGSPNVIKEAMACNLPLVTTDVGDVRWVIGNTPGCFITSYDPKDVAQRIEKALQFTGPTNGRDRILELGLDAETIAEKLISIYKAQVA